VRRLSALRWLIILLVPLTLGWKLAAAQRTPYPSKDRLIEFLVRHEFKVVVTNRMIVSDLPLIHATAGTCRLDVVEASPDGWNRDVIRDLAKKSDQLFIVFRGEVYAEQPTWMTVTHYLWTMHLRKLGLVRREMPVIAVAATASCNAKQLPWAELRDSGILDRTSPQSAT
jgi:hypothetical protein